MPMRFRCILRRTSTQIKQAVEKLYDVKVDRRAHDEPQGQAPPVALQDDATTSDWKRAIVVLDENSRIELF